MLTASQYEIGQLLEQAGAQPPRYGRGKWRCPQHPGSPSLSVDETKGVFNCHHHGCDFHGNSFTLARSLGLTRRLPKAEYLEQKQRREQARLAAEALANAIHARRMNLLSDLHSLSQLEQQAHDAGPDHPATWGALEAAYSTRSGVVAELTFLENATAGALIRFMEAVPEQREAGAEAIVMQGGMYDSSGKFVEVAR